MKSYKLECLNEDGDLETNGYFLKLEMAKKEKSKLDFEPHNKKFRIKQNIVEIEITE